MNYLTSELVFYIFAAFALLSALLVVLRKNPVHSAICLALCFVASAGVMFQLGAHFIGIIQILVYTGAIMVLIIFVVMLLNLDSEKGFLKRPIPLIFGFIVAIGFTFQLCGVIKSIPGADQACRTCCNESEECRISSALKELCIGCESKQPDIPPAPAAAGLSGDKYERPSGKISFTARTSLDAGSNLISSVYSSGEWNGQTITENSEELKHILKLLAENSNQPPPAKLTANLPPIGNSPSIHLPDINPAQVSFPENSSIAKTVQKGGYPDAALLGHRLFSKYNMELIITSFALLVATIGSVVLTGGRPKNK